MTLARALALALPLALAACGRPTEDQCQAAVQNIYTITGLNKTGEGPDVSGAVRSCRASASQEAVTCMIEARTAEDLEACEGGLAAELSAPSPEAGAGAPDEAPSAP